MSSKCYPRILYPNELEKLENENILIKLNLYLFVVILCDEAEMKKMVPQHAILAGARSKLNEEEFGPNQVSEFNRFANIVTLKCVESYFFPDLTFEKHIECALKDGVTNTGKWKGYSGTLLPLPTSCIRKFSLPAILLIIQ